MGKRLKILAVHGVGHQSIGDWQEEWAKAIWSMFPQELGIDPELACFSWDKYHNPNAVSFLDVLRAMKELLSSAVAARALPSLRPRGEGLDWYAYPVVAWVQDETFRNAARTALLKAIEQERPDVILAHSLGSLITYDALAYLINKPSSTPAGIVANTTFVSLGSQIGNKFVVGNLLPGRVEPLPVKEWIHLYNPNDHVFTAPIRLPEAKNFRQVVTDFDVPNSVANHDATYYFSNSATRDALWLPLAASLGAGGRPRSLVQARSAAATARAKAKPKMKAVLIGLNDYADPEKRLDGCVNDCYLMSAVLQERGFPVEGIRMCLNKRATAKGILNRLEWLLDDAAPGDHLIFFYSGHGYQLPSYGVEETVDHMDETLVPYDFDETDATCVKDDKIYDLYSQLPYDTHLTMIFDCCFSGGMHRSSGARIRGISPSDDLRHRALRWDPSIPAWVPRRMRQFNPDFTKNRDDAQRYFGSNGAISKLGVAAPLRKLTERQYQALQKAGRAAGPYQPVILQACQENQASVEYVDGAETYGAFTFHLAQVLRKAKKNPTFKQLEAAVAGRLKAINYQQVPELRGPTSRVSAPVPKWKK